MRGITSTLREWRGSRGRGRSSPAERSEWEPLYGCAIQLEKGGKTIILLPRDQEFKALDNLSLEEVKLPEPGEDLLARLQREAEK